MKLLSLALGLLAALPTLVSAQVTVEVSFPQEQFLAGEALPTAVHVKNRSGQTLKLGGEADWLTFLLESRDGFIVVKTGEVPVLGEFDLQSSQVATKRVDLAPYFVLPSQGRYRVIATVNIKEWNQTVSSEPKAFDIIEGAKLWSQEFGVPVAADAPNMPPEVRKFTLEQANYLRKELRLYMRLTDAGGSRVFKVVPISPMVQFGQPEAQIDRASNLHVLNQTGARAFNYNVFNPDGEVVLRRTYDYAGTRPRLKAGDDGTIAVTGGMRRSASTDLPTKKSADDNATKTKP